MCGPPYICVYEAPTKTFDRAECFLKDRAQSDWSRCWEIGMRRCYQFSDGRDRQIMDAHVNLEVGADGILNRQIRCPS